MPLPLVPVTDGSPISGDPGKAITAGEAAGIPVLIGTNRDEMAFFSLGDRHFRSLDEGAILRRVTRVVGADVAPKILASYRDIRGARGETCDPSDVWTALMSDYTFRLPSIALAEAQAPHAPVYCYLFDWESPVLGGILGSCHALEIPFVFGSLADPAVGAFSGNGPDAMALSRAMRQSWISFARTGSPSCELLGEWPTYGPSRRETMILGAHCAVSCDPRSEEREAWIDAGVVVGAGHRNE